MKVSKAAAGRLGAMVLHATHDSTALTKNARLTARANLEQRLLAEIDPAHELTEAERTRRLGYAVSAHYSRMRMKR